MSWIVIDESKCQKDKLCVAECVRAIIRMKENDGFPEMVPGGEGFCILCGHCVAVCPHDALTHTHIPLEDCPPIQDDLVIDEGRAVQFLRSRRSVRKFKKSPVERDKITRLIEIARYAPTASNAQLVDWIVFDDPEKIRFLAEQTVGWMRETLERDPESREFPYLPLVIAAWDMGMDAVLKSAPALVIATCPQENRNGTVDVTLALSYLELAAPTLGLGTCWAGLFSAALRFSPPVREHAGIPETHTHFYPMMLGYNSIKYHRLPERRPPRIIWR